MTDNYELTWTRNPRTGDYTATDKRDGTAYSVYRIRSARQGQQWTLGMLPAGGGPAQFRSGFDTMAKARMAALATRCYLCGRHRPFVTMTGTGGIKGWRCRDREECERVAAEKDAENRRITAEIRNTPWEGSEVRDTEAGPELVIRTDDRNATVITATEGDLLQLSYVLLTWFRTRYADELAKITEARKAARP